MLLGRILRGEGFAEQRINLAQLLIVGGEGSPFTRLLQPHQHEHDQLVAAAECRRRRGQLRVRAGCVQEGQLRLHYSHSIRRVVQICQSGSADFEGLDGRHQQLSGHT